MATSLQGSLGVRELSSCPATSIILTLAKFIENEPMVT
jgi:hypothetical protein